MESRWGRRLRSARSRASWDVRSGPCGTVILGAASPTSESEGPGSLCFTEVRSRVGFLNSRQCTEEGGDANDALEAWQCVLDTSLGRWRAECKIDPHRKQTAGTPYR